MRTFVAVEVSNHKVIDEILKFQTRLKINAKSVESHNLHFTLQFLGEISDQQAEKIRETLQNIQFSSFTVHFKGIGAFPKMNSPRVIWIGTDEEGGRGLIDLAKKIEEALMPFGFKSDKPFRPHITVFRIKNKLENVAKELYGIKSSDFGSQKITNFRFKQSTLTPKGPVYSDLLKVESTW
ncbi:MAG: RNA 2',3'-cyclic phosphodiesterase [Nitrosarchaeum sp.]|nr:RNA 2',3'-cyclic phosphodiesterase [Nitrosarchaeum sp.]MCA9819415.1 RNA 2',3'-cyclic phosphodiesterase [Nitrosarchaeum sp.]